MKEPYPFNGVCKTGNIVPRKKPHSARTQTENQEEVMKRTAFDAMARNNAKQGLIMVQPRKHLCMLTLIATALLAVFLSGGGELWAQGEQHLTAKGTRQGKARIRGNALLGSRSAGKTHAETLAWAPPDIDASTCTRR